MPLAIEIQFRDARWKTLLSAHAVKSACAAAYTSRKKQEVTVVLASDAFVRNLNRDFRSKDKPTNVLSFPGDGEYLGDIILARQTVMREAKAQDKTPRDHATHLLVHGVLHLLGHDHMRPDEAEKMEKLEVKILKKLGISNPYL